MDSGVRVTAGEAGGPENNPPGLLGQLVAIVKSVNPVQWARRTVQYVRSAGEPELAEAAEKHARAKEILASIELQKAELELRRQEQLLKYKHLERMSEVERIRAQSEATERAAVILRNLLDMGLTLEEAEEVGLLPSPVVSQDEPESESPDADQDME